MAARAVWRRLAVGGLVLVGLAAGAWALLARRASGPGELLTGSVEKGSVRRVVSATGTLKAVVTVQVGSQVTGTIQALSADFNSVVKAGQIVARIDPANFAAQLQRAEADLRSSRARVESAEASVLNQRASARAARANLAGAVAARNEAERVLRRNRELATQKVVSERDLETAESSSEQAAARVASLEAQIAQADAQVRSAGAQLEEARAQVAQSEAAVSVARVNLDHTVISSPIDGVVISRNVDVGQTVAASLSAPTLFVIANDLAKMNVIANIDEADIGAVSDATEVSFTVDAFPGETFHGTVDQVRLEALTQQNVVTYSVIIDVENPSLKLRPGMTASVTMTIAEQKDVLRLPNAALRFWPEDVPRDKAAELLAGGAVAGTGGAASGPPKRGASGAAGRAPGAAPEASPAAAGTPSPAPVRASVSPGTEPAAGGAAEWFARMRDPATTDEERRALRERIRSLPPEERERMREMFGGGGWGRRRGGEEGRPPSATGSTASGELRFPPPPPVEPRPRLVWRVGPGGVLEPRRALVTITDGSVTAVVGGDLAAGDKVAIGRVTAGATQRPAAATNPFAPSAGGMGGGRR